MNVREYVASNIDKTTKIIENISKEGESLIRLPYPFTIPCMDTMFQEMYYWDTYFTNKGLFLLGKKEQAVNNILNMVFLLENYGKIPNGNRTYYLNRSQAPFFGCMLEDVLRHAPEYVTLAQAIEWLEREYVFWQKNRSTPSGLNKYSCDFSDEKCMDAELLSLYKERTGIELPLTAVNGRSVFGECESGWDFSPRFQSQCEFFNPVDLNALLYKDECLLAEWTGKIGEDKKSADYAFLARQRKEKILALMKADLGYYDYNYQTHSCSKVLSAAALYPFWLGVDDDKRTFLAILSRLEKEHGIVACDYKKSNFQWSTPNSWAPLNYIAVMAAERLNEHEVANRLKKKYLDSIDKLFNLTGNLWEKYNGETGELIQGGEYETPPMLGWTAGVYMSFLEKN